MLKISFDFDSCLAEFRQQRIAKKLIEQGNDIWIVTSRSGENYPNIDVSNANKCVFKVAKDLNIPIQNIIFTNGKDKWQFLDTFDMHFDDDLEQIEKIEVHLKDCITVLILDP